MKLAVDVYAATKGFPREEVFGLSSQMRRAAVSIPSNIAEGYGRDTEKVFALFVKQARGSLYELETQIELSRSPGMLNPKQSDQIPADADEIGRMLHGLTCKLRGVTLTPIR